MARRRKAGRKRKVGPRTQAGTLSRSYATVARDFGTLELQTKRRALVGENGDADELSTALGILRSHGYLDGVDSSGNPVPEVGVERRDAGFRYATLAAAVYGPRWPGNGAGNEITDAQWAALKSDLDRLERRLSYPQRQTLDRTVRTNWTPTWFHWQRMGKPLTSEDEAERQELLSALDAIRGQSGAKATAA